MYASHEALVQAADGMKRAKLDDGVKLSDWLAQSLEVWCYEKCKEKLEPLIVDHECENITFGPVWHYQTWRCWCRQA
jgi:hypothetical protein